MKTHNGKGVQVTGDLGYLGDERADSDAATGVARMPVLPTRDASFERRVRNGDPDALEALVRDQMPRVERLLGRVLGRRGDLEDLVQTVLLEMCRALPGYRGDSSLSTFVGAITIRVAQRAMRRPWWLRMRGAMPADLPDRGASPERNLTAEEQLRRARGVLETIAPPKRVAFILTKLEGMSVEDVAAMMGASVSATRSRIYHAQRELLSKAALDPYLRDLIGELGHAER